MVCRDNEPADISVQLQGCCSALLRIAESLTSSGAPTPTTASVTPSPSYLSGPSPSSIVPISSNSPELLSTVPSGLPPSGSIRGGL